MRGGLFWLVGTVLAGVLGVFLTRLFSGTDGGPGHSQSLPPRPSSLPSSLPTEPTPAEPQPGRFPGPKNGKEEDPGEGRHSDDGVDERKQHEYRQQSSGWEFEKAAPEPVEVHGVDDGAIPAGLPGYDGGEVPVHDEIQVDDAVAGIDAHLGPDAAAGDDGARTKGSAGDRDELARESLESGSDGGTGIFKSERPPTDAAAEKAIRHPTNGAERRTDDSADTTTSPEPETRLARYPDFRIRDEESGEVHAPDRPLASGEWYLLDVRITPEPDGIPLAGGQPRVPAREPRSDKPERVLVTLEAGAENSVEIEEPLSSFELPPSGASPYATFRFRPLRPSLQGERLEMMVRMYHRLNLLARTLVTARVAREWDEATASDALEIRPFPLPPNLDEMDDLLPQDVQVDVSRRDGGFHLSLVYRKPGAAPVRFPAPLRITPAELEDSLRGVRDVLNAIAISPEYSAGLRAPTKDAATKHLRALAAQGRQLWTTLFLRDLGSARFELARALAENPPPLDGRVQVTVDADAAEFVFPWALLFTGAIPPEDYEAPDPNGFWGVRYEIDLRRLDSRLPSSAADAAAEPFRMAFMLWDQFRNAAEQKELISDLATRSDGRMAADPPILRAPLAAQLLAECNAQLLYFYTHGYTRPRRADTTADGATKPDPDHDRSWIGLSYGKLYLDELYANVLQPLAARPVVILNMCESAQLTPSLSDSFVGFFLDRGARAVVGTESPMTVEFAHPFARRLLESLLGGQPIGRALLDARRHFIVNDGNPLGLAYSLYGTGSTRFAPPVLPSPSSEKDN